MAAPTAPVLTGGAKAKLTHYGLIDFFPAGAFAEDTRERATIATRALALAREAGPVSEDDVFVIGDTPHDVDCARHFGAVAVAVATGRFTRAQLEGERPDLLFDSFEDVEHAARTLLSHG